MLIRQLEYLVALAEERHFAKAATACHVTQPALSAGIRKLEAELGVPVVRRGNRFEGFTPEGEQVLRWAYRLVGDAEALRGQAQVMGFGLTGLIRLASAPAVVDTAAALTGAMQRRHPRVRVRLTELAPRVLGSALAGGEADAVLTYLDVEGSAAARRQARTVVTLRRERFVLVAPRRGRFPEETPVSWAELDRVPLCVLAGPSAERTMLERAIRHRGGQVEIHAEADSVSGLLAHVRHADGVAVLAQSWLDLFSLPADTVALTLRAGPVGPHLALLAGGVPGSPLVAELVDLARQHADEGALTVPRQEAVPEAAVPGEEPADAAEPVVEHPAPLEP